MKLHMFEYVGGIKNLPSWWKNNEAADINLDQIKELFDTGNNVMLYHSIDKDYLMVDDKMFKQR